MKQYNNQNEKFTGKVQQQIETEMKQPVNTKSIEIIQFEEQKENEEK